MSRPLRILHIANQPGPLRLFMLPLCQAMARSGAHVELACMAMGANLRPLAASGFELHALPPGGWRSPLTYWRLYRRVRSLLKQRQYDLLVAHTPVMSWIARYAARDCVGAVVYLAHGLGFAPQQPPVRRWFFRQIERYFGRRYTDAVLVMNEVDLQACAAYRLTRPGGRCAKIPGVGVDVEAFASPAEPAQMHGLEQELKLRPGVPLVLYLGRFAPAKRPGDILELARRTGDAADYVLAGEGPLWPAIRSQAANLPHVRVLGWTDQIGLLLRRCSLVAFPSVFIEGLPRLLLEAQAAGKPAVAYDVRGSQDAIASGVTGFLAPPEDVDAFCSAVQRLLADEPLRMQMGQAGRQRVAERFSLQASIQAQLDALAAVLMDKGLPAPWSES